ncbi:pyroglutamyl peptidase [Nocardioides sp. KC13]|uniref:Pyroglutamyl peptidase n=1 Tax=Nocardioides turkmenicus TaxID=2711220 RepID=A0A6M1R3B3_9ACTN|nr:pyroglutamyl peptidase [Nocardioides sp. KC13]NGN94734.1 pyroglutamyl peptidase [Nocardioides sp. KC13]
MSTRTTALTAATAALAAALTLGPSAPATASTDTECGTVAAPVTRVEHTRLTNPAVTDILARSGFDDVAGAVRTAVCDAGSSKAAIAAAGLAGRALWQRAVDRVQGRGDAGGDLPRSDDRPLYWARLAGEQEIARVAPAYRTWSEDARRKVAHAFDQASRGIDTTGFSGGEHGRQRQVLASGFDPFTLDRNIRQSNPSGATALAMDGRTVQTAEGPVEIQTVVFPVLWGPFEQGIVEHAFLSHLVPGKRDVDTAITISQGRAGRFDLEVWNGAHRGTFPDNDRVSVNEMIPIPEDVPHADPQPQWTRTTLPVEAMKAAVPGTFPVNINRVVTEIPAGSTTPVTREDPTPGSTAVAGGGGDYLSNESAYRTTALRDALVADTKQGHIHVPVLNGDATGEPLADMRAEIVAQTLALVAAAATR